MDTTSGSPDAENADGPMLVHNNTFLVLKDVANDDSSITFGDVAEAGSEYTFRTVENNVVHAPNITTPINSDAPIDISTTISGATTRYEGVLFGFREVLGTLGSDVADSATFTVDYANIGDTASYSGGSATDQSYWQSNVGTDHYLLIGSTYYSATDGDFSVSYDASVVTITNNTGVTWANGTDYSLKLDRAAALPSIPSTYDSSGLNVPVTRPTSGSAAIGSATGLVSHSDLFGAVRGASPSRGAVEA